MALRDQAPDVPGGFLSVERCHLPTAWGCFATSVGSRRGTRDVRSYRGDVPRRKESRQSATPGLGLNHTVSASDDATDGIVGKASGHFIGSPFLKG